MLPKTVAVVGLGLIGGSLALAWSRAGLTVWGVEIDPAVAEKALAAGAAERICVPEELAGAEVIVLALPPRACVRFLEQYADRLPAGAVVTDTCGVKQTVVAGCEPVCQRCGLRFVGAHPMAGKEHNGFANAQADLFAGASYILAPTADTDPAALDTVRDLALAAGCAGCTYTTPAEHDVRIAFTSQLPHVLAGAYVRSPVCASHVGFAAGSYRDVSRVAAVDEKLWSELFAENSAALQQELDGLIERLGQMRDALQTADRERIAALIREGRMAKEQMRE